MDANANLNQRLTDKLCAVIEQSQLDHQGAEMPLAVANMVRRARESQADLMASVKKKKPSFEKHVQEPTQLVSDEEIAANEKPAKIADPMAAFDFMYSAKPVEKTEETEETEDAKMKGMLLGFVHESGERMKKNQSENE